MKKTSGKNNLMVKAAIMFFIAAFISSSIIAQTLTDTLPHNKNAVIEEFTAVHCSFCPAGHKLLDSIKEENQGRVIAIAMHPANAFSNYTSPYPGSQDFRRSFLNPFFTMPFVHDSIRFFPGAFINRRQWRPNKREQFTEKWWQYTNTVLSEHSSVNIGLAEVYDASTNSLSVDVEVYYADTVNSVYTLYLFLTEDSLIAEQNNGGVNYLHNHIFRESFTPQWGDTIAIQANKKTLVAKHYSFNNSTTQYNIARCHISALVRNAANEEIITGVEKNCDNIILSVDQQSVAGNGFNLFPNPSEGNITIKLNDNNTLGDYSIEIYSTTGNLLLNSEQILSYGTCTINLDFLPKGLYIIRLKNNFKVLEPQKLIKL